MTVGSATLDGHDASVDVTSNSPEVASVDVYLMGS